MAPSIITLTTDYGTNDHLVASVKGTILKINPEATIVDICHTVMSFDLLDGSFVIGQAYKWFPPKTVHVVIVDPGVGTQRRPLLVSGDQHYFVAPDNGVLSMVYEQQERLTVRHVTAEHYFQAPISNTFHGRDIFGPIAGWLTKNWASSSFGEEIQDFVRFSMPKAKAAEKGVKGVILKVDQFGNLITNVRGEDVPQLLAGATSVKISINGKEVTKFLQTYSQGQPGEPFALLGSSGYVEISVQKGSAAKALNVQRGAEVTVEVG
ncbi:MAG: SAM-dependent chlorinase/fluorinase [Acidobacteria bacterium]|nr:SAM-dependent chlorinase/fluorinase [Acidobacteriota bacterium]